METKINITWEEVKELLPKTISLVYIDRNDNFDESIELLQSCLQQNDWCPITEEIDFHELEWESIKQIKKELCKDLQSKYEIDKSEAKEIIEEFEEQIRDYCHDKDDSTPFEDCLRNTSDLIAHYDTGYSMASDSWNWTSGEIRLERIKIKKFLGIKGSRHDKGIDMMISQASYGGQLLIYFKMDFNEFMNHIGVAKSISFNDAVIGIVDHSNGSGDVYDGGINDIKLPFNSSNVFLEKSIKYNWTYSIAGMCSNWADSTTIEFSEEELGIQIEDSPQVKLQKQEEEYNKVFKSGSCTAGDMDINRHRNSYYRNDYPCGNKCKDCGTFWID